MELPGGVAVRVASLGLDPRGRLTDRLLIGTAVRGGLLVDLALADRVQILDDGIEVDSTPTGAEPADRLLAAIAAEPERSLDDWLEEHRLGARDVAGAAVASGRWRERRRWPHPRYRDLAGNQTEADRGRDPYRPDGAWSAADAAVSAIALAAGLLPSREGTPAVRFARAPGEAIPEQLLAMNGAVRWLVEAVTDHLAWAWQRDQLAAGVLRTGMGFP